MGQFTFDYQTPLDGYSREVFGLHALDSAFNQMFEELLAPYNIRWRNPVPAESAQMPATPPAEGYL